MAPIEKKGGLDQEVGEGPEIRQGPIGGGNLGLLTEQGSALGLPLSVPFGFQSGERFRPGSTPHVLFARQAVATHAAVVILPAAAPAFPRHVVLPRAAPPFIRS
jgi:hypothetical protein